VVDSDIKALNQLLSTRSLSLQELSGLENGFLDEAEVVVMEQVRNPRHVRVTVLPESILTKTKQARGREISKRRRRRRRRRNYAYFNKLQRGGIANLDGLSLCGLL